MRRHVENQVEIPEKNSLGILVLLAMWVLALMALSSAARGEERHDQQPVTGTGKQEDPGRIEKASKTDNTQGSQHRLAHHHLVARSNDKKQPKAEDASSVAQPENGESVELTRFILISIPNRQLALVDNGQVVKIYPIAVGSSHTPSPEGNFTIVSHVANPTWSHKGKVVGPGKNNPVGSRWMGLSLKGYGIHGTNAPRSIGKAASHGCFRMGKKDIEELFTLVKVGDTVAVRVENDDLVTQVFSTDNDSSVQVAAATALTTADADQE